MKRVKINLNAPHPDAIKMAVEILRQGGVIIYPTDTCYGIGVDARNKSALKRLTQIKNRDSKTKPFSVIVRSVDQIKNLAQIDAKIERLLRNHLPGPFTFILINLDFRISRSSSIGVRIPQSVVTNMISNEFYSSFTTTSANETGQPSPYSYNEIERYLLTPLKMRKLTLPDLILDAGELPRRPTSTVVDLTHDPARILRQGAGKY